MHLAQIVGLSTSRTRQAFQTGSNTLEALRTFPARRIPANQSAPSGRGLLSFGGSTAVASTSYVSDPANPVLIAIACSGDLCEGSQWYNWLTEDQRFVTGRKEVAVWKLPVLKRDLVADRRGGRRHLRLDQRHGQRPGGSRLIDQYPGNGSRREDARAISFMTNAEIFRGRYLDSFGKSLRR